MRKLILGLAVSLDGFIEGPNGEYDWCFTDQDYGLNEFFKDIDAVFIGRKSYEMKLNMGDEAMAGFPKFKEYVFSTTLTTVNDGAELIKGDLFNEVTRIKNEPGKNIWLWGGASLTHSLMQHRLVDEFWLSVHPVLLGSGKPLFQKLQDRTWLTLIDTKTYETGLVSLKYSLSTRE